MLLYALSLQEPSAIAERTRRAEPGASVVVVRSRQEILSLVSIIRALIRSKHPKFLVCIEPVAEGDALAFICQAKRLPALPKTLLICNCSNSRFFQELVATCCDGILGITSADARTVLEALRAILGGGSCRHLERTPAKAPREWRNGNGFGAPQRDYKLTAREEQVLELIVQGHSNRGISEKLHLGLSTVKTHVGQLLDKLGARDRTQAAVQAIALGLVPCPSVDFRHGGGGPESVRNL